ncbi:MAG: cytidylate kinase family protein [Desulfobacterales bacterium]|jgi:cytidylate kinase|nr:cytidylate kinase family protein [Desulfobacterales bacterium]
MPLITITHGIGSDGAAVARLVAEGLGIPLFDDANLLGAAVRMGLDVEPLQKFKEKPPGWFERLIGEQFDVFANLMGAVIFDAARSGEGVIVGHGSQVLLQDFSCALHVRVVSTDERRIQNLMKQMGVSREVAERLVRKNDHESKGFFRYAFHRDRDDPSLYDVCVNSEKIGLERAAQTIIDMARYPELKACNIYALDALERFSKTRRIEASLREQGIQLKSLQVEVPEKGLVRITGIVENQASKGDIAQLVKLVPGVERVDVDMLMVLPASYE